MADLCNELPSLRREGALTKIGDLCMGHISFSRGDLCMGHIILFQWPTLRCIDGLSPNAPLVVIGGWAGAQDKALSKYAELLASHGYPSVRSVQPMSNIFSPIERPRRQWAVSLLKFLQHMRVCPARPLIFYSFSNGGAFVVEQVKKLAEGEPRFAYLKQAVLGFVFDSAPGYMHPGMERRVLEAEMPPGIRRVLSLAATTAISSLTPLLYGSRAKKYWEEMVELDWGCPSLFLFSEDDPLCDGAKLQGLIAEKHARGQRVKALRWEHSQHCGHLRLHREEYTRELLDFLQGLAAGPRARL